MAFLASYLRFIRHRTIAALILRRRKLLLCVLRDLALYLPVVIGVLLQFHEGYRFVLHQEVEDDALQGLMEKVGIPVPPYAARATVVGLPYRDDAVRQICNRGYFTFANVVSRSGVPDADDLNKCPVFGKSLQLMLMPCLIEERLLDLYLIGLLVSCCAVLPLSRPNWR